VNLKSEAFIALRLAALQGADSKMPRGAVSGVVKQFGVAARTCVNIYTFCWQQVLPFGCDSGGLTFSAKHESKASSPSNKLAVCWTQWRACLLPNCRQLCQGRWERVAMVSLEAALRKKEERMLVASPGGCS